MSTGRVRARATLLTVVTATGLGLAGCGHTAATTGPAPSVAAGTGDPLGSLEASVDAISRQVDSDTAG